MNILILRNLFIFILLTFGQPSFAQSIDQANLQELLNKEKGKPIIEKKLISENQIVANIEDTLHLDLSQVDYQRELNEKPMLMRYFYSLVGKDLNIYGSNEFNQPQDDNLLFFNTTGKNYQLAPGDTI